MSFRSLFPVILFFAVINGCASYEYSNKHVAEQTTLSLLKFDQPITLAEVIEKNTGSSRGLITTDILVEGANLAIQGIKMVIDQSQEKYKQEYLGGISNARFYANNSRIAMMDPDQITFKGFEFKRTFLNPTDQREVAVYARFLLDESKLEDIYFNSKFYLVLDSFSMEYSKVKVNQSKWYLPWSWFLKSEKIINLDFDIDVTCNWIDGTGNIHRQVPFGHFVLPLRKIPLNPNDPDRSNYFGALKGMKLQGASYLIPRSTTFCTNEMGDLSPCFGRGDFSIQVKVVESSKSDFVTKKLSENSDALFDGVEGKDLIKAFEKKR